MLRNGADLQDILKQVVMYDQKRGQLILQLSPKGQQIMNQSQIEWTSPDSLSNNKTYSHHMAVSPIKYTNGRPRYANQHLQE